MPTWTTPGTYTWVVPAGITELTGLELAGGEGGPDWSGTATPGKGGRLQAATIGVNPGNTLTIVVGGQGTQGVTGDNGSGAEGTGADGGNGPTTGTVAGGEVTPAGEGRSGGGGGGGASGIVYHAGGSVVLGIAGGGGGAGGSWPSTPADLGGNGGGGFGLSGSNGQATTLGPGGFYYEGAGGALGTPGANAGYSGNYGRKGANRNGAWCNGSYTPGGPRTGGGGGGGTTSTGTATGGGAREINVSGAGGGGSGGISLASSTYASPTGVVTTNSYQSGSGFVTFTYAGEFSVSGWVVGRVAW